MSRAGRGLHQNIFYERIDDIQKIFSEHPLLQEVFDGNPSLAENQNAFKPLVVLYDTGLLDIEDADTREAVDRGIAAFLHAGAQQPEILVVLNNIILALSEQRSMLTLENLNKVMQLPSLDHLKAVGFLLTELHQKNQLNDYSFNLLLSNLSVVSHIIVTMNNVFESYASHPAGYWAIVFDPRLSKDDLLLIANCLSALKEWDSLSEEKLSEIFSGMNSAMKGGESVSVFLRATLIELQQISSATDSGEDVRSRFGFGANVRIVTNSTSRAGFFSDRGHGSNSDDEHKRYKEKMRSMVGIDTLVERGFLTAMEKNALTDDQRYNLDSEKVAKLVLDGKISIEIAKSLTTDQRCNFSDTVYELIKSRLLTVDRALTLTTDERCNITDHICELIKNRKIDIETAFGLTTDQRVKIDQGVDVDSVLRGGGSTPI